MMVVVYEQRETIKRIINFDIIMKCSVKYTIWYECFEKFFFLDEECFEKLIYKIEKVTYAKIDINFSKK